MDGTLRRSTACSVVNRNLLLGTSVIHRRNSPALHVMADSPLCSSPTFLKFATLPMQPERHKGYRQRFWVIGDRQ